MLIIPFIVFIIQVIMIVVLIISLIGHLIKKNLQFHHKIMIIQVVIQFFLIVLMLGNYSLLHTDFFTDMFNYPQILVHSVLGVLIYFMIFYTMINAWIPNWIPEPLYINNKKTQKKLMNIATISWLMMTVSGTLVYLNLYLL